MIFTFAFPYLISAQEVEIQGSIRIVDGSEGIGKVLISDENGVAQWEDISSPLPNNPAPGEMLYFDGNSWVAIPPGEEGQNLTFCGGVPTWGSCSQPNLLTTQIHTITQSWDQETDYDRNVHIDVPSGEGPFPVTILLHGSGGNGMGFINAYNYLGSDIIRVAPDGYMNRWNIDFEDSKAPDIEFINEILTFLKTFSNVDSNNISIIGSSNGSSLVNRLLVELSANSFKNGVCIVSPKIEQMHNNNNFYYDPTGGNAYDTPITPTSDRRILAISGTDDGAVPYSGGNGILGYQFLGAQNSIYIWAQNNGYLGSQLADGDGVPHPDNPNLVEYNYLSGDVVHYKLIDGTHGSTGGNTQVKEVITSFLGL